MNSLWYGLVLFPINVIMFGTKKVWTRKMTLKGVTGNV